MFNFRKNSKKKKFMFGFAIRNKINFTQKNDTFTNQIIYMLEEK